MKARNISRSSHRVSIVYPPCHHPGPFHRTQPWRALLHHAIVVQIRQPPLCLVVSELCQFSKLRRRGQWAALQCVQDQSAMPSGAAGLVLVLSRLVACVVVGAAGSGLGGERLVVKFEECFLIIHVF